MPALSRNAAILLPLFLASAVGCGGGEGGGETTQPESCSALRLEVAEARPLQRVRVEGVPSSFGELLAAEVTSTSGAESATLVAREEDSGDVWLQAPIHPEAHLEGGEVSLRLIDADGRECPTTLPFHILPLAEAPGTAAAVQARVAEHLDGIAAFFGTTTAALGALEVAEVPEHLLPLYLAQDALAGPGNPDSLQALLDGTAPVLGSGVPDLSLIDALFAELGLVDALDDSLDRLVKVPSPGDAPAVPAGIYASTPWGPANAYQLHTEMEMAQWGESFSGDGPLADGIRKTGSGVGLLGVVPHPATRAGVMIAGTTAFAFTKGAEAAANLLPSRLVSIDFDLSPASLLEDDDTAGRWKQVEVVAASKGWKLDQTILESLLQFTQVKGGYDAWLNRFGPVEGLREALGSHLVTEAVNGTINTHAKDSGVLTIPPRETRPIDITEEPYSFAKVHFALQQEGRQGYRLNPAWEGELRGEVEVGTTLGMFGGRHIYVRKDVAIDPVRIGIDPASVTVAPGEIVRFMVTVHAKDKRVSVHADNGSTIHQPQPDGTHLIIYEAPADEAELPDTLTVTSESTGGFLANQARRPRAIAFIRSKHPAVEIEPRGACVKTGQKQTFTARVDNLEDTRVTWAVDVGTVTQAGVYSAPAEPGAATLTATSVADPSVSDSITIGDGPCNCVWSLEVGGRGSMSLLGSDIHIGIVDGRVDVLSFSSPFDRRVGGSFLTVEIDSAFPPFQRGTFSGWASGSRLDVREHENADEFHSIGTLPLTLSKFDPIGEQFEVEGRLDGTIYWERVGDEGPEKERDWPGHLSLTFRGTMERLGVPGFEDPDNFSLWCNPF